jgi:hypothetical protein
MQYIYRISKLVHAKMGNWVSGPAAHPKQTRQNVKLFLPGLIFALGLSACTSDFIQPETRSEHTQDRRDQGLGKFGGEDILTFGGTKKREEEDTILGVNSHLWRATLDTISFMPLASADPFGGVIITDWYSPPQSPHERLKVNVFILDRQLRSDGLKVSIFRQERHKDGQWIDQSVDPQTIRDLENAILSRARHYRKEKQ